jgi:hypothetical protein
VNGDERGTVEDRVKSGRRVKTADVIHERVLARQQEHAVAQGYPAPATTVGHPGSAAPAAAAPASASPDMGGKLAQLKQLGELRESGVLTDAEFGAQKAQILSA